MNHRVFISYTLRDNEITVELLGNLKEASKLRGIDTFIDIIDNNNSAQHQDNIYRYIANADCLYLIETQRIYQSKWVIKELNFAKMLNIPIVKASLQDVQLFLTSPIENSCNPFTGN